MLSPAGVTRHEGGSYPVNKFVRIAAGLVIAFTLAVGGLVTAPAPSVSAFTGHGCAKTTCKFFTSSSRSVRYYYKRCDRWWNKIPDSYLHGFNTSRALLAAFPNHRLHPARC
jgi:hypothetical protein